jgi:hypothetical protein
MTKYLYGGQVYSIQKLIFSTKKMAEIVGASELLEKLTDITFLEKHIPDFSEKNLFQNAAGHLRYSFEQKENAVKFLNSFKTIVSKTFPSVTYVDTLVEYQGNDRKGGFQKVNNALRRLRNVPTKSMQKTILNGIRNTRTGNHTVGKNKKNEWLDAANLAKLNALKDDDASLLLSKLAYKHFENDLNRIPSRFTKSHIAVIHSDGNGMGRIINAYHESNPNSSGEEFRAFSESIKTATQEALNKTISCVYRLAITEGKRIPFRPIIIGGDDITVACSADDALLFGSEFLKNFEATTRKYLAKHLSSKDLKNGLTACMGIAFIKKNFPFHYAANLAEEHLKKLTSTTLLLL